MTLRLFYLFFLINHALSIKIIDEFIYKDQIINEIDIPSHVNFCTKDVMVSFYDKVESKNKYGFISDDSNKIHELNTPVACEEKEKQLIKNAKFEVKIKDHYIDAYYVEDINSDKETLKIDKKIVQSSTSVNPSQIRDTSSDITFNDVKVFLRGFADDKNDYCYIAIIGSLLATFFRSKFGQLMVSVLRKLGNTIRTSQNQAKEESTEIRVIGNKINQEISTFPTRVQAAPSNLNNIEQQYSSLLNLAHTIPPIQSQYHAHSMINIPTIRESNPPPYFDRATCIVTEENEIKKESDHCECKTKCLTKRCPCREKKKGCTSKCHQQDQSSKRCENDRDRI